MRVSLSSASPSAYSRRELRVETLDSFDITTKVVNLRYSSLWLRPRVETLVRSSEEGGPAHLKKREPLKACEDAEWRCSLEKKKEMKALSSHTRLEGKVPSKIWEIPLKGEKRWHQSPRSTQLTRVNTPAMQQERTCNLLGHLLR